jgi:hypothetical protein
LSDVVITFSKAQEVYNQDLLKSQSQKMMVRRRSLVLAKVALLGLQYLVEGIHH